jgi:hypothetical protein
MLKTALHSVHPTRATRRVFEQFSGLKASSVKAAAFNAHRYPSNLILLLCRADNSTMRFCYNRRIQRPDRSPYKLTERLFVRAMVKAGSDAEKTCQV